MGERSKWTGGKEDCRCTTTSFCNSCLQEMTFEEYMLFSDNVPDDKSDHSDNDNDDVSYLKAFHRPQVDTDAIRKDVKFLKPFAKPYANPNYDLLK